MESTWLQQSGEEPIVQWSRKPQPQMRSPCVGLPCNFACVCVCVWRKCCPFWPFCVHSRGGTAGHVSSAHMWMDVQCARLLFVRVLFTQEWGFSVTNVIVMVIIWLVSAVRLCDGEERPGELGWLPLLLQSACLNKQYTIESSAQTVLWEWSKRSVSRSELWIAFLLSTAYVLVSFGWSCLLSFYFCVSHMHGESSLLIWEFGEARFCGQHSESGRVGSENRLSSEAL